MLEPDPITDQEFALFQRLIYRIAGISLSDAKKIPLVDRLSRRLKSGGYLIIGHSETLNGLTDRVDAVLPTIYRKP